MRRRRKTYRSEGYEIKHAINEGVNLSIYFFIPFFFYSVKILSRVLIMNRERKLRTK